MKAITIRNIGPSVSSKLKEVARNQGKSVNQYIVDLIEQNLGFKKKKRYTEVYHDLDELFGKWSEKDFDSVQEKIALQKQIDKELWE